MKIKLALLLCFLGINILLAETPNGPNIVFIMADDLGIGDVSCYGATMLATPNIDELAKEGMMFNRYYTTGSVCTPTRYAVLTGRYPFRCKEIATGNWDGRALITPDRMTVAALLKQKGYKTAAIGKWHLGFGMEKPYFGETLKPGPNQLGFDYFWGLARNHNDNMRGYLENDRLFGLDPNVPYKSADREGNPVQGLLCEREDDNVNALLAERVMKFIKENRDEPFFVYFTPTIAHTHITPHKNFRGTSKAGQYGDFIQELDFYVGKIMDLLEELELAENTLLIFTSDNGGQLNDHWTAGIGINLADESGDVAEKSKSAKTDARKMGHKTNLDLRDGKGSPYEGGFNVPMIVRWPSKVKAGTKSERIVSAADYIATFSALLDLPLPADAGEDSYSFSDELIGQTGSDHRSSVVLHSKKARSFVDGDWKLVDFSYTAGKPEEKYELYNLAKDPAEANDLSKKEAQKLKAMKEKLDGISKMKPD